MNNRNRRQFLADVGRGMLVATVGSAVATDMGLAPGLAGEPRKRVTFGRLEPLVGLMQDTPVNQLLPLLHERLQNGTPLRDLVSAAAFANARTFGGEDYVGFHTMMALAPAYHMASELPTDRQALPVFKVLYRNTNRLQEQGGSKDELLHDIPPDDAPVNQVDGDALLRTVRRKDLDQSERIFAALARRSAEDAFNQALSVVQDGHTEVHRVVMPYRAWDLLGIVGKEHAHFMLRQSVHYCVKNEREGSRTAASAEGAMLPKLFDQYRLLSRPFGTREVDDAWIEKMSETIFKATKEQAAEAAAAALGEGISPDAIGEAISIATNQLVLRDGGRHGRQIQPNKPEGSVHGDSIGVHACDTVNAWRNMARVSNQRNAAASIILGAYTMARDRSYWGDNFFKWEPRPLKEDLAKVQAKDASGLLDALESAIRHNDQSLACAVTQRYGDLGLPSRPMFDLLLKFAISEDGALHAEKYYRTVTEEFASTRPKFRWRQLVGLARVTASAHGYPAPGFTESCRLLKA